MKYKCGGVEGLTRLYSVWSLLQSSVTSTFIHTCVRRTSTGKELHARAENHPPYIGSTETACGSQDGLRHVHATQAPAAERGSHVRANTQHLCGTKG